MRRAFQILVLLVLGAAARQSLALSFNITFVDDANGTFASRGWLDPNSLFQQNIRAAANLWGARIDSNRTIVVRVDTHSFAARAGGTNSSGRLLYTRNGKNVWEPGPLSRVLTGSNAGAAFYGYDILLGFDANFVENYYWFDPQPTLRSDPVPANRGDFLSVVMHEMGHGFGMTGYRDFPSGQILGSDATLFDDHTYFGGNGNAIAGDGSRNPMFFDGDHGAAVYGADLHLTNKPPGDLNYRQNYFHLSSCTGGAPDGLGSTLMNGCVLPNGTRMQFTPFDLAVYADLGYPLVTPTGDYNKNGSVDAADYVVWRNSRGQTGVGLAADGDLNNQVDAGDIGFWRARFGQLAAVGSGGDTPDATAVPEPGGSLLLMCSAALFRSRRRRHESLRTKVITVELRQRAGSAFPFRFFSQHHFSDFIPSAGPRPRQVFVGRVREHDRLGAVGPQPLDIRRRVFDIQVGADGRLLLHEAEIPIGNVVAIEPGNRLTHRDLVEVLDEQAMGDDADADTRFRQLAQGLRCSRGRWQLQKQLALHDRKLVKGIVSARRLCDAPLAEPPGHAFGQRIQCDTKPLGGDRTQSAVEVGDYAVQVDTEDEGTVSHE
jgi:hypothetical protein